MYLPTYLPTYLHIYLPNLPTYLPTYLPTCLPTYLPTYQRFVPFHKHTSYFEVENFKRHLHSKPSGYYYFKQTVGIGRVEAWILWRAYSSISSLVCSSAT